MKAIISTFVVLVLALALASTAVAQTSSQDGYSDDAGQVQSQVQGGQEGASAPTGNAQAQEEGGLPFTGLDLGLLVGAGCALVVVGFGMRRLARAPGQGTP
jgi:hypothetical protein